MALPDAALAVDYMLELMTGIIGGMRVDVRQMMRNLELTRGLVFSPRVMLALVEAGMDRAEAYDLVQEHTMRSWDDEEDFRDLLRSDPRVTAALPGDALERLFDYGYYLRHVDHIYEAAGIRVVEHSIEKNLKETQRTIQEIKDIQERAKNRPQST